jgi:hypothetical protein
MDANIVKKIRDVFHTIAGFTICYPIAKVTGLFSDNPNMSQAARIVVAIFALSLLSGFFGAAYEFIMKEVNKEIIPNGKDVYRTIAGGILAAFATLLPYSGILALLLVILCLGVFIYDIITINKK